MTACVARRLGKTKLRDGLADSTNLALVFEGLLVEQPFDFLANLCDVNLDRRWQIFEAHFVEQLQRGERTVLKFATDRGQLDASGIGLRGKSRDEFFQQRCRLVSEFEFEQAVSQSL